MGPTRPLIVVDDDASIRDALADYLRRHGFVVETADGGPALDALLAEGMPDMVVPDWMMPGEDGLSICRRLQCRGVPILMLSAMGQSSDRVIGLEVGANDYLCRPFDPREMLARGTT
ncbi:MAG TPA: response regulator [Xanthomonadaceae bacterium]|nr:response regulator [Xanthomonadaceae bacterium]